MFLRRAERRKLLQRFMRQCYIVRRGRVGWVYANQSVQKISVSNYKWRSTGVQKLYCAFAKLQICIKFVNLNEFNTIYLAFQSNKTEQKSFISSPSDNKSANLHGHQFDLRDIDRSFHVANARKKNFFGNCCCRYNWLKFQITWVLNHKKTNSQININFVAVLASRINMLQSNHDWVRPCVLEWEQMNAMRETDARLHCLNWFIDWLID